MCRCASVYVLLLDKQLSLIACVCVWVGVGGVDVCAVLCCAVCEVK